MNIKRAVMIAVLAVAVAALAVPLWGARIARAAGEARAGATAPSAKPAGVAASPAKAAPQEDASRSSQARVDAPEGQISADTLKALGITRVSAATAKERAARIAAGLKHGHDGQAGSNFTTQAGQPAVLNAASALSAALMTTIGGRDNQFSEVTLLADWDGREDCAADREQKVDDFSFVESDIDQALTRTGISEHTRANGFAENVYYYGDTLGNLWVGTDTNPGINVSSNGGVDSLRQVNIPALVNSGASGGFTIPVGSLGCVDDQVTVTGIAVQPVADLGDFGACGTIGEVVYVQIFDSQGCSSNAANQPIRTRIFAFAFVDGVGAGAMTPLGTATNVRQIFSSALGNSAGCAVDDDGSLYFHLSDLIQFTGGAIFKATPIPHVPTGDCSLRSTRVVPAIPTVGLTSVTPLSSASVRVTNYSSGSPGAAGTLTTLFGDIVSITTGPCNTVYAAVSRSFVAGDVSFEQLTEGLFPAPAALGAAGTPSMVISFADCAGAFDVCSGEATGGVTTNVGGILPVADGFSDGPASGVTRTLGVNNFRLFVLGNGPDLRPAAGGTAIIPGTPSNLLKVDMQIDFSGYSGINVSQEGTVFVISGGTPAGIGKNPSPMLGEILCFEDTCPADRRADFVDLRGDALPLPPASGGNVGDGDSDRFDHIFFQAPLDQLTFTPGGLAGLARGHLRYFWRLAPNGIGLTAGAVDLGVTRTRQGDDDTSGADTDADGITDVPAPIIFERLDPGHQVAGGDDQNTPFRGDDDDDPPAAPNVSQPNLAGALEGGFEFTFGGPVGSVNCVWNGFFLNSNGNITFGAGDPSEVVNVPAFRTGAPKIAPAWVDLNPTACDADLRDFPVQALGFANINAFKVRWINVPEFENEVCTGDGGGFSNTFSVTLYDDGTGIDENSDKPLNPANPIGNNAVPFDLQEGPTDLRFTREPNTNVLVGCPPRPSGSGIFVFDYCRMDLLGTAHHPVIVGYSIGGLDPLNPPGLCEVNLSVVAAEADAGTFGVLTGGQIAAVACNCCIGEGTEPTIFELFNEGVNASTGAGGEITFARADFDLRFEGNDAALCTSTRQRDNNRGRICFLGVSCLPPTNPLCQTVVVGTNAVTPTTSGLVNSLCAVQLNLVGCGFFPNETTTICRGFQTETGVPLERPGKTVTTAATLACDTNGDGVPESVVALTAVTPVSCNLVRATIPVSASFGTNSSSGFPPTCCGGAGTVTVTTTFSSGDNNAFGPFTRTVVCSLALGTRAPIVQSVTPSSGPCGILQDLVITGACFIINGVPNVTSVFALDRANLATRVNAQDFFIVNANLMDAHFNFTSANAGKTFLIFVSGPNGTSRNLTTAVTGAPAGCPLGNEFGVQVTFTCNANSTPTPDANVASVTSCQLNRDSTGTFSLDVIGSNMKRDATVTVGGVKPKKIQFKDTQTGSADTFSRIRLKKKICNGLPGDIVVTNPGAAASAPFRCVATCQ